MVKHSEWYNKDYYSLTFPQTRLCCQMDYKIFFSFQSFLDFGLTGKGLGPVNVKHKAGAMVSGMQ